MKKRIICTSLYDIEKEEWEEAFEEWCEDNGLDKDEQDIDSFVQETLAMYAEDEAANLNVKCGDILVIADLGLWDGRHSAYKIIKRGKVNGIFDINTYDNYEYYCDAYNVKANIHHHDGCNHIEFRVIKPNVNIKPLLDALYNQMEVSREMIRRYTTSLRPYVAKVYGF